MFTLASLAVCDVFAPLFVLTHAQCESPVNTLFERQRPQALLGAGTVFSINNFLSCENGKTVLWSCRLKVPFFIWITPACP
jgi:hypothetical protein